jgi:hypothetical protein
MRPLSFNVWSKHEKTGGKKTQIGQRTRRKLKGKIKKVKKEAGIFIKSNPRA